MKRYLLAFAIVALAFMALLIPVHNLSLVDLRMLARYPASADKIVLFGNSVNGATSPCDTDTRVLPEMASAVGHLPLLNFSRGGMTFGEMLRMAELGAYGGQHPRSIIFPISPEAGLFRSAALPEGLQRFFADNFAALPWGSPVPSNQPPATEYHGIHYGNYNEFSKYHFVREKRASTCPETNGVDLGFQQFIYWRNFLQPGDPLAGLDGILPRLQRLRDKHIQIVFWLMPVNLEQLRALHGESAVTLVEQRIDTAKAALQQHGYAVLDSSRHVGVAGFTDRWCGCGHMAQAGRLIAAQDLASWIRETPAGASR